MRLLLDWTGRETVTVTLLCYSRKVYVAFFAICGKLTMAFTFTSLPFNFYSMHELRNQSFQLVSSSVRSKQLLCFVHGQGQKREQKHTTKNFVEFHNHFPLLLCLGWFVTPCQAMR